MNQAVAPATVSTTAHIDGLGIVELQQAITGGKATSTEVFSVLERRILARQQSNRPAVARVIQYRNQLCRQLGGGDADMRPVPTYASRPAPVLAPAPTESVEDVADRLVSAGFDIPSLMTALAQRIGKTA